MKKSIFFKTYFALIITFHQFCNILIANFLLVCIFSTKLIANFTLDLTKELNISYLYLGIVYLVLNVIALLVEISTWKLLHNENSKILVSLSLNYLPILLFFVVALEYAFGYCLVIPVLSLVEVL